jgi:hypothetical protein
MSGNEIGKVKRALVLSGGGAKGAYGFGCLKAFKERDIHFDAVSGTSVGALNALLWSTNSFVEGQKLWDELSFSTVYPVRFLPPKIFPKSVIRFLAIVIVFLNLILASIRGIDHPAKLVTSALLTILGGFPYIAIASYVVYWCFVQLFSGFPDGFWKTFAVGLFTCFAGLIFLSDIFGKFYEGYSSYPLIVFGEILLTLCVADYLMQIGMLENQSPLSFVLFISVSVLLAFLLPFLFVRPISFLLNKLGTVLDSTPLHTTVERILSTNSVSIPTFITTATLDSVYDPDEGWWRGKDYENFNSPFVEMAAYPRHFELEPVKKWIPHYNCLSDLTGAEAAMCCVASAALPFGVVPSVRLFDREFVDGGIVDNVPFYKFIEDLPMDEIYVVVLEAFGSDEEAQNCLKITPESWQENERAQRVATLQKPDIVLNPSWSKEYRPPIKVVAHKQVADFPKLIFFYPKDKGLGNFLTGTLNFNNDYAREIMKRGYLETMQKLGKLRGDS